MTQQETKNLDALINKISFELVNEKILEENQARLGIECKIDDSVDICFRRLIQEAYKKYQKKVKKMPVITILSIPYKI